MVDRRGIEPRPEACKATVLPLSLSAQIVDNLSHCTRSTNAMSGADRESRTPLCAAWKAGDTPCAYPQKPY